MAKRVVRCNYEVPIERWGEAAIAWNEANQNMIIAVRTMILGVFRELCPNGDDDNGFMDISNACVRLYESDGELEYSYEAKYIQVSDDEEISIISEDDYGNEDERNIDDLTFEQIYSIGAAFKDNFDGIMNQRKTYKNMVEKNS